MNVGWGEPGCSNVGGSVNGVGLGDAVPVDAPGVGDMVAVAGALGLGTMLLFGRWMKPPAIAMPAVATVNNARARAVRHARGKLGHVIRPRPARVAALPVISTASNGRTASSA